MLYVPPWTRPAPVLSANVPPLVTHPLVALYSRLPLPARFTGVTLFEATQLPALQKPPLQSASEVQLVLQLAPLALHWYTPQELGAPATQVPVPLQAGTGSSVPLAQ